VSKLAKSQDYVDAVGMCIEIMNAVALEEPKLLERARILSMRLSRKVVKIQRSQPGAPSK
jgi:hypothetical protein